MKEIAAVVVTYNRKELLIHCIEALLNLKRNLCDIIIIDNNSSDGTEKMIKTRYSKMVNYYNTGDNLGGAGGFNYGLRKAVEQGYKYAWLMDDDCIVQKESLEQLLKESEELHNEYGFLCSRVLWKDDTLCRMNIPKISYSRKINDNIRESFRVIMATFVSFFVRCEVVKEVGLPIKDFFIWADDLEYSRRISRNYPCYYVYASVVTHLCKSNIGSNLAIDNSIDLGRYFFAYRNEYYLYRSEGLKGRLFYFVKRSVHRMRIFLKSDRKREKLSIINDAIMNAKSFWPKVEYIE